jgi:hypothetical protein
VDDSFANDKSILESLKNKQNLIIISFFKYLGKLNYLRFLSCFSVGQGSNAGIMTDEQLEKSQKD